jgi:hypothetical protein
MLRDRALDIGDAHARCARLLPHPTATLLRTRLRAVTLHVALLPAGVARGSSTAPSRRLPRLKPVLHLWLLLRTLLVRGEDRPAGQVKASTRDWHALLQPGTLKAEELLRQYTRHVFALESENLQATARRLDLDRRTVQAKLDAPKN